MQYEEVVKMIEDSEKRVDEILKSAKLKRHEKEPMSKEVLAMLLNYAVWTVAMLFGFGLLYMIIYFMGTAGR